MKDLRPPTLQTYRQTCKYITPTYPPPNTHVHIGLIVPMDVMSIKHTLTHPSIATYDIIHAHTCKR